MAAVHLSKTKMVLDRRIRDECTISSMMYFVLFVSRIGGVSPITFSKVQDGWRVRESSFAGLYGILLIFIVVLLMLAGFIIDLMTNTASLKITTDSLTLVAFVTVLLVELVVIIGAYTGMNRMRKMIDCLAQLSDINTELLVFHPPLPNRSRKRWYFFIIFSLIWAIIIIAVNFCLFINKMIINNSNVLTSSFYILYNIFSCMVLHFLVMKFGLIAMSVVSTLQLLNMCLNKMLENLRHDVSTAIKIIKVMDARQNLVNIISHRSIHNVIDTMANNRSNKQSSTTIRRLGILYCSICDMVREINECHGFLMVFLVMSLLLDMVIQFYYIITVGLFKGWETDNYSAPAQAVFAVYSIMKLVMIIEPCQRTHEQFDLTGFLIKQLLRFTPSEDLEVIYELKRFYRHYILKQVSYSPLKLFTLDRMLIAAVAGTVPTYLIVVIQLK